MRHIEVQFHLHREILNERFIFLRKIDITNNLIDILTKVVSKVKFQYGKDLTISYKFEELWIDMAN